MKFNLFNRHKTNDKTNSIEVVTDSSDYSTNDNDYRLVFNETISADIDCQVISFGDLTKSKLLDRLTIYKTENPLAILDLRYSYSCSYKKEAIKFYRFVAVGLSGFLYLYDLSTKSVVLFIDFNGYFDGFTISDEHLLVAYNSGIYCLTKYGQIKWHNNNIGLDGIIINKVENGKIYGSEQIDPPDGWTDFILDIDTGNSTK
ncbi:hypothetical protein [Lacibacter sp. H407]|uniref:hypothetical protein n=1 Tax=Lacibacter sp. H407 TaxID=3133423 RepID=UPI0030C5EB32